MSIEEAIACLDAAMQDRQLSRVEPNMTRRQVVMLARAAVVKVNSVMNPTLIDISKALERHVLQVSQDCLDPVKPHYCYSPEGHLYAGWNKEEVKERNGEKPKTVPPSFVQEVIEAIQTHQQVNLENKHPPATYAQILQENNRAELIEIQRKIAEKLAEQNRQQHEELLRKVYDAHAKHALAIKPSPPKAKSEPPKDPSDPKFCIKRPKPKL